MRFLDVGVAAVIGLSSLGLILSQSPAHSISEAATYGDDTKLLEFLIRIASSEGLPWMQYSPPETICGTLQAYSDSNIIIKGSVDGLACPGVSPAGAHSVLLTLVFPGRQVTLQAWSSAGR